MDKFILSISVIDIIYIFLFMFTLVGLLWILADIFGVFLEPKQKQNIQLGQTHNTTPLKYFPNTHKQDISPKSKIVFTPYIPIAEKANQSVFMESKSSCNSDFFLSMLVAEISGNTLLGFAAGGDVCGSILGAQLADMSSAESTPMSSNSITEFTSNICDGLESGGDSFFDTGTD